MNTHASSHNTRRPGLRLVSCARALLAVSALAALAMTTRSLAQVPTFNTAIVTSTGSAPWQPPRPAAVGDFNGDGKLDAMIVDGSAAARFMYGYGNGTFSKFDINAEAMTTSNMVNLPASLAPYMPKGIDGYVLNKAADVNGDGKLDVICVTTVHINWAPYSLVTVLTNTGNDASGLVPQFSTTNYFLGFYDVRSLTVGDLNGDGKPEFIVGSAYAGLHIYRNNGGGTFTFGQATYIVPNAGGPAVGPGVIADMNGDGKADFIVTSGQANATDIFLGNGDGTLQAPTIVSPAATTITVGDLNGDGKPDLIEGLAGSMSVYLNNGNGTFASPVSYSAGASAGVSGLFVSDVNGDGKLDVAASLMATPGTVAILAGNGNGTLGAATLHGTIRNAVDVTLGDFTGDGKLDIASVSADGYGGQNLYLLTNTTPVPVPAQLFFTDALTGPTSPNLASIPAGKYGYTATGLQRTQSSSSTDRPIVTTALNSYLAASTGNFGADITVKLTSPDILFFGLGQGDVDTNYFSEPDHAFYFRVHSNWGGNNSIQGDVRAHNFLSIRDESVYGYYAAGSTITLRITRVGDTITMAVVGGVSTTYSLSTYQAALGLTASNTRVFFGNTSAGSVFSNLKIYALPSDVTPPVITAPANITAEATSASGAAVSFTATAVDDVDGPVPVVASPASGSTFALGTTAVGLAASDAAGNTATASFTVTVRDTIAPVVSVPGNITAEATSASGAAVSYPAPTATDAVGVTLLTSSPASGSTFALGTTTVTATAKDAAGNTGTGSFTVSVVDTTAPVITSLSTNAPTLWPPNHRMVAVTVSAAASDLVGVTSLKIISATSSEPDNGLGDGDTAGDIVITGNLTLNLRAERSGSGNGRTYTITVEARDAAGNASTKTVTVSVPKSQGGR